MTGIWLNILNDAARGEPESAWRPREEEISASLLGRGPDGAVNYTRPLPRAVAAFISRLPAGERAAARLYEVDLRSQALIVVAEQVRDTARLAGLCFREPGWSLDRIASTLEWKDKLNRPPGWRRGRVADWLRSMLKAGVALPPETLAALGDDGEAQFAFNEVAMATGRGTLEKCWSTIKKRLKLDADVVSIDESEAGQSAASEGANYGFLLRSGLALQTLPELEDDYTLDLIIVGEALTPELGEVLERMHAERPRDGYRPVAWHRVFWDLRAEYPRLRLAVEVCAPYCEEDGALAEHIVANYTDLAGGSRPFFVERRKRLRGACDERIQAKIRERFE